MPGVQVLGVADLGDGQPANATAFYNHDTDTYIDLCLALPARFDASRIEQIVTNPDNSFGLQLFDPSGDTPNSAQTVSIQSRSR